MLGIVHHSPVIISVIIDRALFKKQLVIEDDISSNSWSEKVDRFRSSPAGKRSRVLFVEKVDSLQKMLSQGFDPSPFKIVLYDDNKILANIEGIEIVDAKIVDDTWKLYKLLPEKFNKALEETETGAPSSLNEVDLKELEPTLPEPEPKKKKKPRPVVDSSTVEKEQDQGKVNSMEQADAVMSSIISGTEGSTDDIGKELASVLGEPETAPEPELPHNVDDPPVEVDAEDTDPELAPKPEPKKTAKKTTKKKTTKTKAKTESHKLF